nr:hypothetical protein [Tanacetum cinerariifolium]
MVAYLTKSNASEGFNQIIDFLTRSPIKYALTVNLNIYVSCIKQFWTSVAVKKFNDVMRLQALVDKKKVVVTEATIRDALRLDDAEEDVNAGDAAEGDVNAANAKVPTRLKKLERRNKVKVLKLRRLQKVGTRQRVQTSYDTVMDDVFNQGMMIAEMDQDADVVLKEVKDVAEDAKVDQDADVQVNTDIQARKVESQAKIYKIDLDHANKVLSMQEDESKPAEVQEVVDVVTTAKLITEVVTTGSTTITADEAKEDPAVKRYQALKKKPQTEAQARKNMMLYLKNVAGFKMDSFKGMSYDDISHIFEAKFNSNRKQQKGESWMRREGLEALWGLVKEIFATAKPKNFFDDFLLITLGVMFEKPDIHAQIWKNQRSVHGPTKVKERKYPLTRFTLDQMLNVVRLEVEEESKVSLELLSMVRNVDNPSKFLMYPQFLQVMINAQVDNLSSQNTKYTSPTLTQKVFPNTRRIGKGFLGVETPLFDAMLVQPQVHDAAEVEEDEDDNEVPASPSPPSLAHELSSPPQEHIPSPPQAQPAPPSSPPQQQPVQPSDTSESSMTLLNTLMETCATLYQKGRMEEDATAIKELNAAEPTVFDDEQVTMTMAQTLINMKDKKQRILNEQMAKRLQDEEIEQMQEKHLDNIKKYQSLKRKPISIAQARKNMIVYLKNMARYKIQHFKGMNYDQRRSRCSVEISEREFNTTMPTVDREKALWVELKRLYEPNAADVFWKLQRYMHDPLSWKLYTNYGVHQVTSTRRHHIFITEMGYPLIDTVLLFMLSAKLQVDEDCEMARDPIMKIFMEANKPKSRRSLDTSSN